MMERNSGRAIVFYSFLKMHEYIEDHRGEMGGIKVETVLFRHNSGVNLWSIQGLIDGYINYIWTSNGWNDIDYHVEMYEWYTWESSRAWGGEPYKEYHQEMEVINFRIMDQKP